MPSNEPADLIALLVALLSLIASKEVAALIGPYAAIFLLACAGAALSLSGNEKEMPPIKAVWYVTVRIMVAIALTGALAELLQNIAPWMKPRYTLVPLAFGIGFIRDYESVRKWAGSVVTRFTDRGLGTPKGPTDAP